MYDQDEATGKNLYAVKRRNVNQFHTGYDSYVSPRLYVRLCDAQHAVKKLNRWHPTAETNEAEIRADNGLNPYWVKNPAAFDNYVKNMLESNRKQLAAGEWIVVPVEITVKNID
jgi:ribosomal protein S16